MEQIALPPNQESVREQVRKIQASRFFVQSERLSRFLDFAVTHALLGNGERLKEYSVGVEVFDRKPPYDPRIDPIVRVEARRLRSKLKSYYASLGRADSLRIDLPKGTYTPVFRFRSPDPPRVRKSVKPARPQTAIAVLPFENLTKEPEGDYFSDGLSEELIHRLTRLGSLRVVAWHSAAQLRGREEDLSGLRELLKIDTVLRGSVRRAAGRVRITAQLIDAASGAYLWSETYDSDLQDVFSIQDGIAQAIVTTLQLTLTSPREEPRQQPKANPEAYNLYLQGRFHWNKRTGEGLRKSLRSFERAAELDPNFALAFAGLADAYTVLTDYGMASPSETMPKAKIAAVNALNLDPNCAEALTSLAMIRSHFEWNWAEAETLYRRAIEINPGYSTAHHWIGIDFLAILGRFDEAAAEILTAIQLDPLSLILREGQALLETLRGDYDEALSLFHQLLDLDPAYYKAYSGMGRVFIQQGRYDDAIGMLEKAFSMAPDIPNIVGALGQAFALAGRKTEALGCLDRLQRMEQGHCVFSTCLAVIHLGLGEKPQALERLCAAVERRELSVLMMKVHPIYDPLRSDPVFQGLLAKIGLGQNSLP